MDKIANNRDWLFNLISKNSISQTEKENKKPVFSEIFSAAKSGDNGITLVTKDGERMELILF